MKKEYIYIGLAVFAVGGIYWYSKNNPILNTKLNTTGGSTVHPSHAQAVRQVATAKRHKK